jgi:photosystem II stability/assembly factor-like uncharacterized protein
MHNFHQPYHRPKGMSASRATGIGNRRHRSLLHSLTLLLGTLLLLSLDPAQAQIQEIWKASFLPEGQLAGIALHPQGTVTVTGTVMSNVVTTKYSAHGTALWSIQRRTQEIEYADGLATDPSGGVWVVARTRANFDAPWSAIRVFHYTADGAESWVRQFDGEDPVSASILVDNQSNALVVLGAVDGPGWVLKYSPEGERLWSVRMITPAGRFSWPGRPVVDQENHLYVPGTSLLAGTPARPFLQRISSAGAVNAWTSPVEYSGEMPGSMDLDAAGHAVVGFATPQGFVTTRYRSSDGTRLWSREHAARSTAFQQGIVMDVQSRATVANAEYQYHTLCTDCGDDETRFQLILDRWESDGTRAWNDASLPDRTFPDYGDPRLRVDADGSVYLAASYASRSDEEAPRWETILAKLGPTGARLWATNLPGVMVGDLWVDAEDSLLLATTQSPGLMVRKFGQPRGAPKIVQSPAQQSLRIGEDAVFRVSATGFPSPSYQWRFQDDDLVGETNAYLALRNLNSTQAGNYSVEIRNALGSTVSPETLLEIRWEAPRITSFRGPETSSLLAGSDVALCATVTGGPEPQLRWRFNGMELPGETNACLALQRIQPESAGLYTLVASNAVGLASTNISLDVIAAIVTPSPPGPHTFVAGSCGVLCATVGIHPPFFVQWQRNGANVEYATNLCLSLCPMTTEDSGLYRVKVSGTSGRYESEAVQIAVVLAPPESVQIRSVLGYSEYYLGEDAVLMATHAGSPGNFQWFRNGSALPGRTNQLLELFDLTVEQAGTYNVVVSNVVGTAPSDPLLIEAKKGPPQFDFFPPTASQVREGDTLELPFHARGGPTPHLVLQHANTNLEASLTFEDLRNPRRAFVLPHVTSQHQGNYQIIASNTFGAVTSAVAWVSVTPTGPIDRWTQRNPLPQSRPLFALAHDTNGFMAVGEAGTIVVEEVPDAWVRGRQMGPDSWRGLTWGAGVWVAVGNGGSIVTSTNRVSWIQRFSRPNAQFSSVVFSEGRFLAVGSSFWGTGLIAQSPDAVSWELRSLPEAGFLYAAAYGENRWVAVGIQGIVVSEDGQDWRKIPIPMGSWPLNDVAFADDRFMAVGNEGRLVTSDDGVSWAPSEGGAVETLQSITHGNGRWVAVGIRGVIRTSTDGRLWVTAESGTPDRLEAVDWDGRRFVATGENGTLLSSADGLEWTLRSEGSTRDLDGMTVADGTIVIVGKGGTILTSRDGVHFTQEDSRTFANLHGVARGRDRWVAVGEPGVIVTSEDGKSWVPSETAVSSSLKDVIYDGGQWIAVGTRGTILRSEDGIRWTASFTDPPNDLNGVAYGDGVFLIAADGPAGKNGSLFRSVDGMNWTLAWPNANKNLRGITFHDGQFVIAANDSRLYVTDREAHSLVSANAGRGTNLRGVTRTPVGWIAVGNNGLVAAGWPPNGPWATQSVGTENLHRVVHFDGRLVAIGNRGSIFQSDLLAITLSRPVIVSGVGVAVTSIGEIGRAFELQISTNLIDWRPAMTFTNRTERTVVFDEGGGKDSRRFYRVRQEH